MSINAFRMLVLLELVLAVGTAVADVATRSLLPEPLRVYLDAQEAGEMTTGFWVVAFVAMSVLAMAMIASIGLLILWRPARLLFTLSYVIAIPLYLFMGPNVSTGITEFITELASFLGGVIWALLYFSPIKAHFDTPAQPLPA